MNMNYMKVKGEEGEELQKEKDLVEEVEEDVFSLQTYYRALQNCLMLFIFTFPLYTLEGTSLLFRGFSKPPNDF
jgi:hypothetical protein